MFLTEFFTPDLEEGVNDPDIFKAIFLAGPPGAGKNTVIRKLNLHNTGLKLQDFDQTLHLLQRTGLAKPMDYVKSQDATMKRQSLFLQNMLGLIINTTGRDYEQLLGLNKQLKTAGYDTFMLFVDVEYDVALSRIHDREKNATDPADRRPVDMEYFVDAYDNSKNNLDFYALMFGNQFAVVTNNERLIEDDSADVFNQTVREAGKKVARFLRKPLTPTAQTVVAQAKSTRQSS
jgi:predicted kinase